MKLFYSTILLLLSILSSRAQNPIVSTIATSVQIDSLLQNVRDISGENEVTVNGVTDTIRSRHITQPGNYLAFHYLYNRLNSYGLQVDSALFTYSGQTGQNVLATKTGLVHPNQYFIICAHYDGMPTGTYGPAADDDGSGLSTVLEAARILSQYDFEYTIVFALWDIEEQGLRGSAAYALAAQNNGDSIMGVLNMDAIAWDGDADGLARIHTRPVANSVAMADSMLIWNTLYNLNVNLSINNPGATYSDHASFWNKNFSAVLLIEDFDNDGNPHYHTNTDKVEFFDAPYYHQLARLAITSMACFAVPVEVASAVVEVKGTALVQACYPNPVSEKLQLQLKDADAQILLTDLWGCEMKANICMQGSYAEVDFNNLPAGIYFVWVMSHGEKTVLKVQHL